MSPSMLEAMHLYCPAEPRLTPCHNHRDYYVGEDDDVDVDDDVDDDVDVDHLDDVDDDNLKNECGSADQDSTLLILLNPNSLRRQYLCKKYCTIFVSNIF